MSVRWKHPPGTWNAVVRPCYACIVGWVLLVVGIPASSLLAGISGELVAQGRIEGVVVAETGTPLPGANVSVEGGELVTAASETGWFVLPRVPAGVRRILISRVGYRREVFPVQVEAGKTVHLSVRMKSESIMMPPVVVTGTRNSRQAEDAPVAVDVVSREEIETTAPRRLTDLLEEQLGLTVVTSYAGNGIQMQGLDPDYTLILVDGEPVIGRISGTLELDRFALGEVEQVEIVKGPMSSLYGSEALAGVVNLITRIPQKPFSLTAAGRFGNYWTTDVDTRLEALREGVGLSLSFNRSSSAGYDHTPETRPPTVPRYASYTLSPRIAFDAGRRTEVTISSRLFVENQHSIQEVRIGGEEVRLRDHVRQLDWSLSPRAVCRLSSRATLEARLHATGYRTRSDLFYDFDGSVYDASRLVQRLTKGEVQVRLLVGRSQVFLAGAGGQREVLRADRIAGGTRAMRSAFLYVQEEWLPAAWLHMVGGARLDTHSDYGARFTPRASLLLKPLPWVRLRASAGAGFKAPDFRQLFLDFTNPTAGYSVLGSTTVGEGLARLEREGQIEALLVDSDSLSGIRAENSVAFSGGVEFVAGDVLAVGAGVFHNRVKDLIETAPIAVKRNGQSVYTYFNLNRVTTRGLEVEASLRPVPQLQMKAGYQLLAAVDEQVVDDLQAGQVVRIDSQTRKLRRVEVSEYGGLFNRSRHSATLSLIARSERTGLRGSIRATVRGRFGYRDRNLNGILDDPVEYAPGTTVVDLTLSKRIGPMTLQASMDDLMGATRSDFTPAAPGRTGSTGLTYEF